eukprot:TRINITY_DN7665_c1_g1_i1.p2 TRINITY_DN7665_c1_g1~~TRINITY_DN7665_c1_g1_i1.p2  ORF type:complete len:679 (+),score=155.19 TRINITY_DN7665_c1_g1_i1:106-2037(+)
MPTPAGAPLSMALPQRPPTPPGAERCSAEPARRLEWRDPSLELGRFLQEIVHAVQRAQEDIAGLRGEVAALAADLHGDRGVRQHVMQTDAALTSVCEVLRVERRKREAIAVSVLLPRSTGSFLGRYWRQLREWARCSRSGSRLSRSASLVLVRLRWETLKTFHRLSATRRRQRAAAARLVRRSVLWHARRRLDTWLGWHAALCAEAARRRAAHGQVAADLAVQSAQTLLHSALRRWQRWLRACSRWRQLTQRCRGMCEGALLHLAARYWRRLCRIPHRRRAMYTVAVGARDRLRAACWARWRGALQLWRLHERRFAAAGSMFARTSKLLARRRLHQWLSWLELRARRRQHAEDRVQFEHLAQRVEALGGQIDVGLRTLTNTNAVLNRLVDRFIAVDDQLEALDKDKVGRRELSGLADTRASTGGREQRDQGKAAGEAAHPLSSARDLLRQAPLGAAAGDARALHGQGAAPAGQLPVGWEPVGSAGAPERAGPHGPPTPTSGQQGCADSSLLSEPACARTVAPPEADCMIARLERTRSGARDRGPLPPPAGGAAHGQGMQQQQQQPLAWHISPSRGPRQAPSGDPGAAAACWAEPAHPPARGNPAACPPARGEPAAGAPSGTLRRQQEALWVSHFADMQRSVSR